MSTEADAVLEALGGKFIIGDRVRFAGGAIGVVTGSEGSALGHTWWWVQIDMPDTPHHKGLLQVMDDDIERV